MSLTPSRSYEDALGDALEALINDEPPKIEDLVDGLNARNVHGPRGERWTVALLKSELSRLGA